MSFANPIWLWGLSALLIPLAIHLWSRQKTDVMPFGSVRFLQETASSRSNRLELTDVLLMILRMILLVLVMLLLAGLLFPEKIAKQNWLVLGEGIKPPQAYDNEQFKVHQIMDLKQGRQYLNQWFFMKELSDQHPKIDSLIWIDNFEDTDFWGAIPALNYSYELINKSSLNRDESDNKPSTDTAFVQMANLSDEHKEILFKTLKTNSLYTNNSMVFLEVSDQEEADIFIGTTKDKKIPLQFIFDSELEQSFAILKRWPIKTVYLSREYLEDKLLQDQLLLIITEQLAQAYQPLWNYNRFAAATRFHRGSMESGNESFERQKGYFSDRNEWLLWIIVVMFCLERYWVYKKANA